MPPPPPPICRHAPGGRSTGCLFPGAVVSLPSHKPSLSPEPSAWDPGLGKMQLSTKACWWGSSDAPRRGEFTVLILMFTFFLSIPHRSFEELPQASCCSIKQGQRRSSH